MNKIKLLIVVLISSYQSYSAASIDDEDYDSIVNRLSTKQESSYRSSSLDNVMFHMGLSFNNTVIRLDNSGETSTLTHQGYGLTFGIDLLSPKWVSEVAYVDYGKTKKNNFDSSLKEFELKVTHKPSLTHFWGLRMGAGLAARYQALSEKGSNLKDYTTPATLIFGGIEAKIIPQLSLVSEISYKNSIISDSPEKRSLDFLVRLDGHL